MSNAKTRNTRANVNASNVNQNDVRDKTNAIVFPTNESITAQNAANEQTSNATITLKSILTQHKIKTDPKLIRRVLRKYYASKINHAHRDAWIFPVAHVDNVVALIDKHCRAGVASK
jgi:hypothetical protein